MAKPKRTRPPLSESAALIMSEKLATLLDSAMLPAMTNAKHAGHGRAGRAGIDLDVSGEIEAELRAAEDMARAVLAEHAETAGKKVASLDPERQRLLRLAVGVLGGIVLVDHEEPARAGVKPRPCKRCPAAQWLLFHVGEIRFALKNGAGDVATLYALRVGPLRLRLALWQLEDEAGRGRDVMDGPRHPRRDLLNHELEKLLNRKPGLTVDDVFREWDSGCTPDAIVSAEENIVEWHDRSGEFCRTSRDAVKKRLQRLQRQRKNRARA